MLEPAQSVAVRFKASGAWNASAFHFDVTQSEPAGMPSVDHGAPQAGIFERTDSTTGRFYFPCVAQGQLNLVVDGAVLQTRPVLGPEQQVVFALDKQDFTRLTGSCRAVVVDGVSGKPISPDHLGGAVVSRSATVLRSIRFPPAEGGRVEIKGVPGGRSYLHLDFSGYAKLALPLDMQPGQTVDLGTIAVPHAAQALGEVRDWAGSILQTDVVAIDPRTGTVVAQSRYRDDYLGAHFALGGLPVGTVWLAVRAPGVSAVPIQKVLQTGLNRGLALQAREGHPVKIRNTSRGLRVVTVHAQGRAIWQHELGLTETADLWLAPGAYEARAMPSGSPHSRVTRWPFEVGSAA
ncbi:MAG: hypothetical protein AAFY46_16310, partial [Planctomycetota bacterium]